MPLDTDAGIQADIDLTQSERDDSLEAPLASLMRAQAPVRRLGDYRAIPRC